MVIGKMAEPRAPSGHREFRLLIGVMAILLLLAVVALVVVVLFFRSAPIRGHPSPSPSATAALSLPPASD